jgi:hypothetical protein
MREAYVNFQHGKYTVDVGDVFDFARKLERELAEVTEQRDELARQNKLFRNETLICADCDAVRKDEYDTVIQQRDEARIELEKYTTDSEDDALYNVRRLRKELTTVTEQRDMLAEALRVFCPQLTLEIMASTEPTKHLIAKMDK